jgi:ADP-ribosylglycohydrolase
MRAAPVGLVFGDRPMAMVKVAHTQSAITHRDPRCSAGSIVVAGATALALDDRPLNVYAFCHELALWARRTTRSWRQRWRNFQPGCITQSPRSLNGCARPIEKAHRTGAEYHPL